MRFEAQPRAGYRSLVALLTLLALVTAAATAAPSSADPTANTPTPEQVAQAVAQLNADPNLGTTLKTHRLRWRSSDRPPQPPGEWAKWLLDAFAGLARGARVLVWVAAVLAVGMLALLIKRLLETRVDRPTALSFAAPTHVREMDIRPESLPADIGGSALELWERDEHRAALALLYRGALSRLAHVYRVPIRDSSTEGDCAELATAHVPGGRGMYVVHLIDVWKRAVYGHIDPTVDQVRSLCASFAAEMDAAQEQAA